MYHPAVKRAAFVEKTLGVQGVVDLREMFIGRQDIHVVGTSMSDITHITDTLHELRLTIESSEIMRQRRIQPFNHFSFKDALDDAKRDN